MQIASYFLHRLFEKDYGRQSPSIREAFIKKKDLLLMDRNHRVLNNHPLHGKLKGCWSINISGNIRAIYRIEKDVAIFMAIGTHSELYE